MRPIFVLGAVLLAAAIVVVYGPAFPGSFVGADVTEVRGDVRMGDLSYVASVAIQGNALPARPVGNISFILNRAATGAYAQGFLFFNIILHVCNAWLVIAVVTGLLRRGQEKASFAQAALAVAAGAVWGLHPLNSQAVATIYQRHELWMTFFTLSAMLVSISYLRQGTTSKFVLLFVLGGLAGLSKETAAILPLFPFLLGAIVPTEKNDHSGSVWRCAASLFLAPIFVATMFLMQRTMYVGPIISELSPWQYVLSQTTVVMHYFTLIFWPFQQSYAYDWQTADSLTQVFPQALVLISILAVGVTLLRLRSLMGVGVLWMFLALAPTSSLLPLNPLAFEARMYLPMVGFVLVLAGIFNAALEFSGVRLVKGDIAVAKWQQAIVVFGAIACIAASVGAGWLTRQRAAIYQSPRAIWEATAKTGFAPFLANLELAELDMAAGDYVSAENRSSQALESKLDSAAAWSTLSMSLSRRGQTDQALALLKEAQSHIVDDGTLSLAMGNAMINSDPQAAIKHFERATELAPGLSEAWNNLGILLARSPEKYDQAEQCYHRALGAKFDNKQAYFNLAALQLKKGKPYEARASLYSVQRLLGNDAEVVKRIRALDELIRANTEK